jgi:hypothetical protein
LQFPSKNRQSASKKDAPAKTMKPKSPLPWKLELDDVTSPMDSAHGPGDRDRRCRLIRSIGGPGGGLSTTFGRRFGRQTKLREVECLRSPYKKPPGPISGAFFTHVGAKLWLDGSQVVFV